MATFTLQHYAVRKHGGWFNVEHTASADLPGQAAFIIRYRVKRTAVLFAAYLEGQVAAVRPLVAELWAESVKTSPSLDPAGRAQYLVTYGFGLRSEPPTTPVDAELVKREILRAAVRAGGPLRMKDGRWARADGSVGDEPIAVLDDEGALELDRQLSNMHGRHVDEANRLYASYGRLEKAKKFARADQVFEGYRAERAAAEAAKHALMLLRGQPTPTYYDDRTGEERSLAETVDWQTARADGHALLAQLLDEVGCVLPGDACRNQAEQTGVGVS